MNTETTMQTDSAELAVLQDRTDNLCAQADAAEINTKEDNDKAADLVKLLTTTKKKVEADRTSITGPINDVLKNINSRYKPTTEKIDKAVKAIKGKMSVFAMAEMQRQERDRRERIAKEEAEALAAAEKAAPEEADKILEEASTKTDAIATQADVVRGSGDYGATSYTTKKLIWDVTDPAAVPAAYLTIDAQRVQLTIDKMKAAKNSEGVSKGLKGRDLTNYVIEETAKAVNIPGIELSVDIGVSVR